ncbi:NUDIX domain-containing protein [Acuticoccus mangrovi]|uniref:NUDIX domain-containing protein n=1 Tax=Acuticoccus mangrovi TaxID=2796142 RepID=A0A934ILT1_9HYPH|nr:NUDIX domain-containing protein [Acuticoccus mangrovi]MBJ3778848.1 NUDIX domain-containing protein [Acuticoccus mangrovi]
MTSPRLAARAVIVEEGRLLLVNAYPDGRSDLWCAPGGGIEAGTDIPSNLKREVHEETGLTIEVGPLVLLNEFHSSASGFHQVDLFFRATILAGSIGEGWRDPAAVVTERRFFSEAELSAIRFKPDSLAKVAFGAGETVHYDALEELVV